MFGNVTSSWANPQQNQQQQQQPTGAFGQPSAFGATNTTNAFGSTSAFGQPQQQQQPQANPMFGNLGAPAANTGTTGFGTFGSTANTAPSAFGAKPTTGFGAFGGGTPAFGSGTSTTAFGQPAATTTASTGLFGQPAPTTNTTSAFGGTGLFGQNKPTGFGVGLGTASAPVVTTGTSNPPYAAHHEKDGSATLQYQAISCMPAYSGSSFEELRVQDYAQGRKTAGSFGQSAAFGTTQPTTSLFGATQSTQTQNAPSAFGTTTAPAAPTTTGFGGFGTNTTTQPAGGLFGAPAFGATQQQQPAQTSAFGSTFGAQPQQQPQQSTGLFGNSAFGNTASKPAFGFGATGTTTNAFGGTTFGAAQNPQQQPTQPTSLFGATQQQPATTTTFGGAFGSTANKPLFGSTTITAAQPTTNAFGSFGTTQQQPQQQNQPQQGGLFGSGGGLFGNQQQQQPQQQQQGGQTSLFGNTNTQPTGTGLFGSGGGLFGGTQQNQQQQQQQQQPSLGLFGNKTTTTAPAGGPLFGGGAFGQQQQNTTNQAGGGMFGASTLGQNTNQQAGFGGNLFGQKPAAPQLGSSTSMGGSGLFGSTLGSSMNTFGATATAPGAQGTLTASISQPIGSNLPIFSMLPPGPRLVDLDQSQPKKKPPFFVDVPTRSPIPRVQQNFAPTSSKLRGFGSSTSGQASALGNPFAGNNVSFLGGKPNNALALSDARASSVGPDSFLGRSGSPALGSGPRHSVKKVILDKKIEPSQLFVKSGSPSPGGKIVFSPALSIAARESEAAAAAATTKTQFDSPTPAPRGQQRSPNRFTAQSTRDVTRNAGGSDSTALEDGDYWVKPDLASLKKLGYDELSAFKGLVVGRVGYGEIEFLEPVDLTGLPKLSALLGEVIHFEEKECSVYPDSEDADKPPPGSGLNVKAKLTLERCWAVDKATREPIKDASHPTVIKHLKRLKNMKETHFQGFDMETGRWTFTVDHF